VVIKSFGRGNESDCDCGCERGDGNGDGKGKADDDYGNGYAMVNNQMNMVSYNSSVYYQNGLFTYTVNG
jgi:hypothetical protein